MQERWFSAQSLPHIFCSRAPRQRNEYDCGVYMLAFVEHLATAERLPSFATTGGIIDAFPEGMLTEDCITAKRQAMRQALEQAAEAQRQREENAAYAAPQLAIKGEHSVAGAARRQELR